MPMIRINAEGPRAVLHRSSRLVESVLQQTQDIRGPVIIMTHGYKYRPGNSATCPHRHILALRPRALPDYSPSWPQHLGFGSGFTDEGLAVAFGWNARGPLWTAQRRAQSAGRVLADVINKLHRLNPDRPIHFIGHSMGVELAIEALHHISPGALKRIISMTGATYRARVLAALALEAGRRSELINITSRENDLFDFLYEQLVQPPQPGDRSVGAGIDAENAVTLQIDCNTTLAHLSHMIAPSVTLSAAFAIGPAIRGQVHCGSIMPCCANHSGCHWPRCAMAYPKRTRIVGHVFLPLQSHAPSCRLRRKPHDPLNPRSAHDRPLFLAHAKWLESIHRFGRDGPALHHASDQHR
ncbi:MULTISPECIES: alpha/beta hydrolase [unclassified Ruegeria]|uniref:alpha/beta hydrolase n=1 Tax=unclassified Ruegeria TaxID=2625375 RepID=UPI0020C30C7A|nr:MULTISPECIES: alpha/beta hydrolase [unclassified Ruegeria]